MIANITVPTSFGNTAMNAFQQPIFETVDGRFDIAGLRITAGADPNDHEQFDYWDHIDFAVSETKRLGLVAIILPRWGDAVAGDMATGKPGTRSTLNENEARANGKWIGERYRRERHVIWMLGGDRSAVYKKPVLIIAPRSTPCPKA